MRRNDGRGRHGGGVKGNEGCWRVGGSVVKLSEEL